MAANTEFQSVPISAFERYSMGNLSDTKPVRNAPAASADEQRYYSDITMALAQYKKTQPKYTLLAKYYAGKHPLAFATAKFREAFGSLFYAFSDNLLPALVQAPCDRLEVSGFSLEDNEEDEEDEASVTAEATNKAKEKVSQKYDAKRKSVTIASQPPAPKPAPGTPPNTAANAIPDAQDATGDAAAMQADMDSKNAEIDAQQAAEEAGEIDAAVKTALNELMQRRAWRIWNNNNMPYQSERIMKGAFSLGDSYVICWPDDETGKAVFFPQAAMQITVCYDESKPGKMLWGAKQWIDCLADKTGVMRQFIRLNMYYPDSIVKFISRESSSMETAPNLPDKASGFALYDDGSGTEIPNPYDTVPIFHFAHDADIGKNGNSDFIEAIPIQNALNKSVMDMLIAMEFAAYAQRWATGVETDIGSDGKDMNAQQDSGINRLMKLANENAKVGQFSAADLTMFVKVSDSFRVEMARVTGTPLHYMALTSTSNISGETIKMLDGRLTKKAKTAQKNFGAVFADLIEFALIIEKKAKPGVTLYTTWQPAEVVSEKEQAETVLLRKEVGIDGVTALMELGFGRSEAEDIVNKQQQDEKDAADAQSAQFNAGGAGMAGGIPGATMIAKNVSAPRVN